MQIHTYFFSSQFRLHIMFTVRFNNLLNIEHEGFKHKVIEDAVLNSFWLTVHKWPELKKIMT